MRDWIRLTKTLEHGTTKTTKRGFGGFGGNEPIVSFNKINERIILDQIVQKTIAEGSILYKCDSSDHAKSLSACLKQMLPYDRGVCVIRENEVNTFTLHFSSSNIISI